MSKTEFTKLKKLSSKCFYQYFDSYIYNVNSHIIFFTRTVDQRINIVKDVDRMEDTKLRHIILNDFHTLLTGGVAGAQRMCKNIRARYF